MSDTKLSAHEWSIAFCHRQHGRIYMDAWSTTLTLMDQGVPESGCASLLAWRDRLLVTRQTRPTPTEVPHD